MTFSHFRRVLMLAVVGAFLALMAASGQSAKAQDAQWLGLFWNNTNLSGTPVVTRWENSIDFNWFSGSPDPRINSDNFSARWTRNVNFPAGNYRFFATMDDGMRIWIDNQLVVDSWTNSQEHTMSFDRFMNGNHDIRIDYFEAGGQAVARFRWDLITSGSGNSGAQFPNWRAQYFNRPDLAGTPVLVRDDRYINNNWGTNSPGPGVNSQFWSVRWTRQINALPGQYRIVLTSDDGSRLFINGRLIVDNWRDQASTASSADFFWNGGVMTVVIEYYNASGPGFFNADLITISGGIGSVLPAPPTGGTGCSTAPTGNNAQSIATTQLNIRRGPSTQFEPMGTMAPCEIRPLSGFRNGDSTWVQIITANGQTGWVSSEFVRLGVGISTLSVGN